MVNVKNEIGISNDWGKLREGMVGYPDEMVEPDYSSTLAWMTEEAKVMAKKHGGKKTSDVLPENAKALKEQVEKHVKILEDFGVKVHRARKTFAYPEEAQFLDQIQRGVQPFGGEDYFNVIGNNVILINALRPIFRRKQIYLVRPILEEILKESNARYVAMPPPSPHYEDKEMFLENGDVLRDGKNIYVGFSGHGSSEAGIAWLQQFLGLEYKVHTVKMVPHAFHLDACMSLNREGLLTYYPELLPEGLPESLKKWEKIELKVDKDDLWAAACNTLALDDKTLILAKEYQCLAAEYEKRGIKVITSNYGMTMSYGAGPRCLTGVLKRD
jgi:N-dimethylarginine dimethylaminohydrolase